MLSAGGDDVDLDPPFAPDIFEYTLAIFDPAPYLFTVNYIAFEDVQVELFHSWEEPQHALHRRRLTDHSSGQYAGSLQIPLGVSEVRDTFARTMLSACMPMLHHFL